MTENEYRVRPVTRYIVTHYVGDDETQSYSSECCGEFDNIDKADRVGRALSASDAGSTFVTVEDRREPVGIYYAYTTEQSHKFMSVLTDD